MQLSVQGTREDNPHYEIKSAGAMKSLLCLVVQEEGEEEIEGSGALRHTVVGTTHDSRGHESMTWQLTQDKNLLHETRLILEDGCLSAGLLIACSL